MPRPIRTIGETKHEILATVYFGESRGFRAYDYDIWRILKTIFHVYLDDGNLRNVYRHPKDLEELGLLSSGPSQVALGAPRRQPYLLTYEGRAMKQKFSRYTDVLSKQIMSEVAPEKRTISCSASAA